MSRLLPVSLALALGLTVPLAGCDRESGTSAQQPEANEPAGFEPVSRKYAGEALPDLTVKDPSGKALDLAGLKGQPVLINLWATWCAPCKAEMPALDAIAGANQGKLRVVTVSQDAKGAELVLPYFKEAGFRSLEPWLDQDSALSFSSGSGNLPTTMLYDAAGKEVVRIVGEFDWTGEEAQALIAEAIGGA